MAMEAVLSVKNLAAYFYTRDRIVKAVDGVSLEIRSGTVTAIVGESGCGKTVTAMSILGLLAFPGRIVAGEILLNGRDLRRLTLKQLQEVRGGEIAMIFQDPVNALNPVLTVGTQMIEAVVCHRRAAGAEARALVLECMGKLGLPAPDKMFGMYPFQLSGGMCQRIMIATALSLSPSILIADEPTTALDVTVQAQILDELCRLKREFGTGILLITHDLGVVAEIADVVYIMQGGLIVESGTVYEIFDRPVHPYTKRLLQSFF